MRSCVWVVVASFLDAHSCMLCLFGISVFLRRGCLSHALQGSILLIWRAIFVLPEQTMLLLHQSSFRARSAVAGPGFDPGHNTPVFNTGGSIEFFLILTLF